MSNQKERGSKSVNKPSVGFWSMNTQKEKSVEIICQDCGKPGKPVTLHADDGLSIFYLCDKHKEAILKELSERPVDHPYGWEEKAPESVSRVSADMVIVRREDLESALQVAERDVCFRNFTPHRRLQEALENPSPPPEPDHQPEKG